MLACIELSDDYRIFLIEDLKQKLDILETSILVEMRAEILQKDNYGSVS